MWSLGSADVSLLVPVRADSYATSIAEAKAADSRGELNVVYINDGALVKLSDGACKIAYKVAKVGSGPLEVCFGAAPGSRPSKDFKASAAMLNAALNGKKGEIVEICLGFSGGVFTTPAGVVRVSAPTPTGPNDDSAGEITIQTLQGNWAPVGGPQRKDLQVFLDGVTPRAFAAIPPAGSTETVSMVEMPLVMRVLRASELMPPAPADGTELMEVKVLGEFLGGAFDVDSALTEKVKIISAAIRLQGYMAGSTALRKGAVWQRAADGGACKGLTAAQAGEQLRECWFVSQPVLLAPKSKAKAHFEEEDVGGSDSHSDSDDSDDDDDDSDGEGEEAMPARKRKAASGSVPVRKAKVAKSKPATGILLSLIPRDGSITAMQTASIMFGEARVRDMVAFEALPDVIAAEQEPVLEMRAERALGKLVADLGSEWRPAKRPKSVAQLRLVAEELYTLATERVLGGPIRCGLGAQQAKHSGGSSGMGGLADLLSDSKSEQAPMELKLAQAAVPARVAESLAAHRLAIETAVGASPGDPAAAMAGITDSMVRDDLARVMSSNGRVHAPGERENHKRSLPPHCHTLRESLLLRVLDKLIARGGKAGKAASGARMVPRDKAWPLAEAAMAGNFDWEAYVKMSRLIEGPAAAAAGTAREVAETFAVVRVAWAAVVDVCYPTTSDALEELLGDLTRTAVQQAAELSGTLLQKHYNMLLSYVQQLLAAFADMVTAFRKGSTIKPSVSAVVALHSADWMLLCQMSSVWHHIPKQQQQPQQRGGGGGGKGEEDDKPSSSKLKRERKEKAKAKKAEAAAGEKEPPHAPAAKAAKTSPVAGAQSWPNKPKFEKEVWLAICENFKKEFPDHCSWFALTKCKRDGSDCRGKHELPDNFKTFCEESEKLAE